MCTLVLLLCHDEMRLALSSDWHFPDHALKLEILRYTLRSL